MDAAADRRATIARYLLAGIRLTVGTTALFLPRVFVRRLGVSAETSPGIVYVARMFGVRTIVIGADVLIGDPATRDRALRAGVIIHCSDVLAALLAGLRHQMPARAAARVMLLSAVNAGAAMMAQRSKGV